MGFQKILVSAFLALAFCPGGRIFAGPVVLKPRLIPGSEAVFQVSGRTVMRVPRDGESTEQKVNTAQKFTVAVERHEDEKSRTVRVTVNSIAVEMEMPGMVMRYDSADPATTDARLGEAFKGLINKPVDMVYDESDEFVKMASTDAFAVGGNSPFGQQIGPEQVKQMALTSLARGFPEEVVSPGDSWTYSMAIPISAIGEMEFDLEYRYRNDRFIEDHSCAVVDVKGKLKPESLEAPRGNPEAARRIDDGFDKGELSGVVVIDKELRLIRESEFTLDFLMRMPSPLGQEKVTIPLRQEATTTLVSFRQLR